MNAATMIEILPPHRDANGMTYRATIYTAQNDRLELSARVSEPLRRKMAAYAQRAMAWMKGHVRLPSGPLQDLMAGDAPDCGCDGVGEAFRAACLQAAGAAEDWVGEGYALPSEATELVWDFDDWSGVEDQFLGDIQALAYDAFGATVRARTLPIGKAGGRTTAVRGGRVTAKGAPGLAVLQQAFRAVLGH